MTTEVHIHSIIPGSTVALFALDGDDIKSEIFCERVFWWTITKSVEYQGDALLRVRCGKVAPFLPFETTVPIKGEEVSVSAVMCRDTMIDVSEDELKPAHEEFCEAMAMWARENFNKKVHLADNVVAISDVGIIKCQFGVVIVVNENCEPVRLLWEDPDLFDKILEILNG